MTGVMTWTNHDFDSIPGTYVFNGRRSVMGYPLNRMCMSFNTEESRQAFLRDEEAYCNAFGLSEEQRQAVRDRDVLRLIKLGGNIYYLAKLAGIFRLNVQDIGAQQTGMSVDDFKAMLIAAGE
jgi:protocatechuate 4,5-dioxygenase alpha chain